ncbi:MAG: tRNA-dihydrouridine synthase family protein [Chitinispirillaceae bacterium]
MNTPPILYLAPLRGITDRFFRSVYERHFGCFDYIVAPFISTVKGNSVRLRHLKDTLPEENDLKRLIPQIIGNDTEGFLLLCKRFSQQGFEKVNWNLGCPSPLITRKRRGSGLLPHKDEIRAFLEKTVPSMPLSLSVKVRLGLEQKGDLEKLIPVFNDFPLREVIIHPRTGNQMYDGSVDLDTFETCYYQCTHEVVYNGDIQSKSDLLYLSNRFPRIRKWMIGRGLIRYPYLLPIIRGAENRFSAEKANLFLSDLLEVNCRHLPGERNVLGKMKELWGFLGTGLDASGRLTERILRCSSIDEYRAEIESFLRCHTGFLPLPKNNIAETGTAD